MQKCAVLKFQMFCLQSTKANGIRTLFEAAEKNNAILHGSMVYGVSGGPERPGRTYYVTHRCI